MRDFVVRQKETKIENRMHALSLYFAYCNFCRIHQSLRVTPAMEASVTDHAWTIEELVTLAEQRDETAVTA